jgi:hypothetical protein
MLISSLVELKRTDQLINGGQRILLRFLRQMSIAFGRCGTGVSQDALNVTKT